MEYAAKPPVPVAAATPGLIKRWSWTLLSAWERCPRQAEYKFKRVEPDREKSPAAERGILIHRKVEDILNGEAEWSELDIKHDTEFWRQNVEAITPEESLRLVERKTAVTQDWEPTEWKAEDAWAVGIPDLLVLDLERPLQATVVDFKSGRSFGNEISHMSQLMSYASLLSPSLPHIQTWHLEAWYLDEGKVRDRDVPAEAIEAWKRNYIAKGQALSSANFFPANPSKKKCEWCDWRLKCEESMYQEKQTKTKAPGRNTRLTQEIREELQEAMELDEAFGDIGALEDVSHKAKSYMRGRSLALTVEGVKAALGTMRK